MEQIEADERIMTKAYNWRAVAAQIARCRSKVLSIPYVYYFRAYNTKGSGTEDKSFAKNQETSSQASRKGHRLFRVSKCMGA